MVLFSKIFNALSINKMEKVPFIQVIYKLHVIPTHQKVYHLLFFQSEFNIGAVITAIKGKNLSDKIPKHIEYLYVPVVDHQSCDISLFFKDSYQFINQQRKRTNVLVHCMAGVSRSVTLVIAYIMEKSNTSFDVAYQYVKSKRKIIHPNQSFIKQLKQLQRKLKQNKRPIQQMENRQNKRNQQSQVQKAKNQDYEKTASTINKKWVGIKRSNDCRKQLTQMSKTQGFEYQRYKNENKNKQNSRQNNNNKNYDDYLRQNIKKLFSLNNSKINFHDKNQLIR